MGPNELITNDPEVIRKIWAVRSPYTRAAYYDAIRFDPKRDNLLSLRSEKAHNELKAKMAPGYSGKENEALEPSVDRNIADMIALIERKYVSAGAAFRPLDFAKIARYFTLDVISDIAFSKQFGYLEQDGDVHEYIKMTEESMPVILVITVMPWIAKVLQSWLFSSLLHAEKHKIGIG